MRAKPGKRRECEQEDDRLAEEASRAGVKVFRGSYEKVGERLYKAAKGYKYFIRITGDDIFTDTVLLQKELRERKYVGFDYQYCSKIISGMDFEIIKRSALNKIIKKYGNDNLEHIEHFFKNDSFKVRAVEASGEVGSEFSLTMDTPDDFRLITTVFPHIAFKSSAEAVYEYLKKYPLLSEVNKRPLVSCYTVVKDVDEDEFEDCVNGVIDQEFDDFEYYIVDYGSKSLNYLKKIPNGFNYKLYTIDCNGNFIEAIKFAHSKAAGKYVIRADADDVMRPDCIEMQVGEIGDRSMLIPNYIRLGNIDVDGSIDKLACHALVEKKKLDSVTYVEGQTFRDGTALLACFLKFGFKIGYVKEPLFYHRVKSGSLTADKNLEDVDISICQTLGASYEGIKHHS